MGEYLEEQLHGMVNGQSDLRAKSEWENQYEWKKNLQFSHSQNYYYIQVNG